MDIMKIRDKSPALRRLIEDLNKARFERDAPIWRAVAEGLNRPRRKSYKVNVFKIEKYAKPNDRIIVPGTVLGTGEIKKPVIVAALKFSKTAREKIEKAGGKCMTIQEMVEKYPDGSGITIMG